jgi:hypothetical protein
MRVVEVFEIAPRGIAFYRDPARGREYRIRLGGETSGYAWEAPLTDKGSVVTAAERQLFIGGGNAGATVMWSGNKSDRATIFRAMRKAGLMPKLALDE